jgi:hypothetical protein
MTDLEKQVSEAMHDFLISLPENMKTSHFGAVICTLFEAFDIDHDERAHICKGVVNVMLEAEMRSDERAAQAADDAIARAAEKARK